MREYGMVDKSLQTKHTGTYSSQCRVGVDVRGRLFVTTRYTEKTSLTSQLAMLADSETTYIWTTSYLYRSWSSDTSAVMYPATSTAICHLTHAFLDKFIQKRSTNCVFFIWATKSSWKSEWKTVYNMKTDRFIWNYEQWLCVCIFTCIVDISWL